MFGKKNNNYFYEAFLELGQYTLKEMDALAEGLGHFDKDHLLELKNSVHRIEHEADLKKKEIEEKLAKEFITPIDREDIFVLLDEIDDVSDSIDEVSFKLYIRNYEKLPPHVDLFLQKSKEAVSALLEVLSNFDKIDKKDIIQPKIDRVLEIEEQVDILYEEHVHDLYLRGGDYKDIRLGERIYANFETVTDKCRDVCKTILIVMYKNL